MAAVQLMNNTTSDFANMVSAGQPLTWTMNSISDETFASLRRDFSVVLDTIKRTDLKMKLDYCLREFCVNSQKAMIKRVFFQSHHSDMHNLADYERLLPEFRSAWVEHLDVWERKLNEKNLSYQVLVQCKDGFFNLFVANPGKVLPIELERIRQQIDAIPRPPDEELADGNIGLGQSEGGGLGILLIGRMLESMGCPVKNLTFRVYDDKTVFMIRVPLDKQEKDTRRIHSALAYEVEKLPNFPETLIKLQERLNQPDLSITHIAAMVKRDVGFAAAVLKTANSAAFMKLKKVTDLSEAITYIGLRGLKALLLYHGMETLFGKKYSHFRGVMEHSHQVAAIAGKLAKKFLPKQIELAYVGGLLHDMGQMIILDHPDAFMKKIGEFHKAGAISTWCFENLAFGLDHAELGALVAGRWNFPTELESIIRYHHDLSRCPIDELPLTQIVYFADAAARIANGEYPAYLLDPEVLERFNLKSEDEVRGFAASLLDASDSK
jgi:putative nucleotidyltransferase with HDIG domain